MIKRKITRNIEKKEKSDTEAVFSQTGSSFTEDEFSGKDIEEEMFDKNKKKKSIPPPEVELIEEPKEEPPVQEEEPKPLTPPQSPVKQVVHKAKTEEVGGRDVIFEDTDGNKLNIRKLGKNCICPCGTTIKTGMSGIKSHIKTKIHNDRMSLINEGKNPNEHHDWLYRERVERIKNAQRERNKIRMTATAKMKNESKPIEPIKTEYNGVVKEQYQQVRAKEHKKVEVPQFDNVPDDFEDRVNKEVERRYKIKREREEREAQLVREAEERVRKEFEERYSKPALPTKTMQNPVFNRSSAFAQRNRRFGY